MTLTTTSYAILGQLALKPWTMYELAAEMRRNLHFFFARAESQVYAEPKRLVAAGLAKAEVERIGSRPRTEYSITPAGRKALKEWLETPISKPAQLEFEALLRVIYAPFGRDECLEASLHNVRDHIDETLLVLADRISDEYKEGRAPFQRYAQYRCLMHDFLLSYGQLLHDWAERSLERVSRWPDMTPEERHTEAVTTFHRRRPRRKKR